MQVTFLCLYLFFYTLTLWCLLLVLIINSPIFFSSNISFTSSFSFLKNYTKYYFLVYLLFFLLSGLPPVGIFFLKFSILIFLLQYWNIAFAVLTLVILFINTIFYLQIFKFNKYWVYLPQVFSNSSLGSKKSSNFKSSLFPKIRERNLSYLYSLNFFIFLSIFFLFFSILFISDIFLCFMNITTL